MEHAMRPLIAALILIGCGGDKDSDTTDTSTETGTETETETETETGTETETETETGTETETETETETAQAYAFDSAFGDGSSVSYSGQIARHVLIHDMTDWIATLTADIPTNYAPVAGDVTADLMFYFDYTAAVGANIAHDVTTDVPDAMVMQVTYGGKYDGVSSGDKPLRAKLAGNDPAGQYADWNGVDGPSAFVGWGDSGLTPTQLVETWIGMLDDQAVDWVGGDYPLGPDGTPVPYVYITPQGHDLEQLLQKFLLGSIAFSQGADDYLDDDTAGKGLMSSHEAPTAGLYTDLEHQWDEGFGYFGAARTYGSWTDDQIKALDADVDGDGKIDLNSEYCWGHSVNAAKRDFDAIVETDFTADAWDGFIHGRTLLSETAGTALTDTQMTELQGYRDHALEAWEKAIAATVVHYINDTLMDYDNMMGTSGKPYSFEDHAKHWSELKGFALSLQFNRRSPMIDDDTPYVNEFAMLHELLGTAPVLETADDATINAYTDGLLQARSMMGEIYNFDEENLGDETKGTYGW